MSADELRKFITATPFTPFHVRAADGRRIAVPNRDFILISPPGRHVYVFQPDGSHDVLDIQLIPSVEFGPPPADLAQQSATITGTDS